MERVEKLSANEVKNLEEQVSLPYRVEDVTVLSEGEWNGLQWTASELQQAVENTDFEMSQERGDEQPPNASLFFDHDDRSADQFVGRVENVRMEGRDVKSDLVVSDKQTAMNLEFGAPFGVSPKADGLVDEQGKMQDFEFENFSLVVNPAVKTTWLNEDITQVLEDLDVHTPKFRRVTEDEWNSPNLEDFVGHSDWEELSSSEKTAVGKHFLVSKSGFPADTYSDLALPVVNSDGELNRNALQQAKSRVSQVSGIEEDEIERVEKLTDNLANGNFPDAEFGDQSVVEMQDWTVHRPDWSSKADKEWNEPNLEDFTSESWSDLSSDEKSSVGNHFIASETGFPSENFGDMALPVVEPDGTLNLNALANAKARANQVGGMSDDEVSKVKKMITNIANEEFEDADFEEVENQETVEYEFGEGDKVKWDNGSAMGVVRGRTKTECYNDEIKGSNEICGKEDNPAYLIEIFDDEEEETTGTMVAHLQDTLNEASFELKDTMVRKPMADEQEPEQEPSPDESPDEGEESVENSEDYVTAEELEDFKSEVIDSLQEELGDSDEEDGEEDEGGDVEESEGAEELSEFQEFRQENPELSLSEAAEQFEQEQKDVEDQLEEMQQKFEEKISDLEEKLESKEEEVEELSEKVSNPQRATQASGAEEGKDLREEVSELSDEELHAAVFQDMMSDRGVTATKEMIHNE